jgi:D-alanine-D-alanine ligase
LTNPWCARIHSGPRSLCRDRRQRAARSGADRDGVESKSVAPKFATYRLKNDGRYRTNGVRYRRAQLPRRIMRKISEFSKKAFRALKLRDYARLDFRLTNDGRLVFIEANPNSDLTPHTLGRNLCFVGIEYRHLIPRIVETARKRYRGR